MRILPHTDRWCWTASKLCFVSYVWEEFACWNPQLFGTLMLIFSKLKPQTLHIKPPILEPQTPTSKLQNPKCKPKILPPQPLFQTPNPHPNIENMCHFFLLFHLCHDYLCHFYWTLPTIHQLEKNFKLPFIAELWTNSIKSSCNSSENFSTKRYSRSHVKLKI